jgi:outer membrane protein OmpA-like peptidoglycan-associated protein
VLRLSTACLALAACLAAVPAVAQTASTPPGRHEPFKLFFQADSVELAPDAMQLIDDAARVAIENGEKRIIVMGFADRVGSTAANLRLSRRRAEAVKAALVARGVPATAVYTLAFGEVSHPTETADGVREPLHRFVTITLGQPLVRPGTIVDYLAAVFFDSGSTRLSGQADRIIGWAASWTATPMREIVVAGHADRVGPSSYNLWLSRRRAEAVKAALIERGVPADLITIEAFGEDRPLVPTEDGVPEPQNRFVDLVMEPVERPH